MKPSWVNINEIQSTIDYYPFGMEMPGRVSNASAYRFGMNGQMKDNEFTGQDGAHTTAMFWEYDSRIGRRWNRDPKPEAAISQYVCFGNNPVLNTDINGDTWDPTIFNTYTASNGNTYSEHFVTLGAMSASRSAYISLLNSSKIFKIINHRIASSKEVFSAVGNKKTVTGFSSYGSGKIYGRYIESDKENNNLNTINIYTDAYESNKQLKSTMFEETFHAAQADYYGVAGENLAVEVEAKFAKESEGLDNTYGFQTVASELNAYLKDGTAISSKGMKALQKSVDAVAKEYGFKSEKVNTKFISNTFKYLKTISNEKE